MGVRKWKHPTVTREKSLKMIEAAEEELLEKLSVAKSSLDNSLCDREITLQISPTDDFLCKKIEQRLKQLKITQHKIQKGDNSWGICEKCKKPILELRLEMYPEKTTCIDCLRQNEQPTRLSFGEHTLKFAGLPIKRLAPPTPIQIYFA